MSQHDEPAGGAEHDPKADSVAPSLNRPELPVLPVSRAPVIPRSQQARPPALSRALIAAGFGINLGALGLLTYGFTVRVPHGGRAPETSSPVTEFLVWQLVLGSLTAVAALGIGVGALLGRTVSRWAAALLVVTVAMTAWAYMSSVPASIGVRVSGFGARPAPELAQLAWPMLAVAAALILVGAVRAINTRPSVGRSLLMLLSPWTAAGVALSLVAGLVVAGWWWPRTQTQPATADPVAVAPFPATVGRHVAYSKPVADPESVQAAGPGFVTFEQDGAITAFDGATGGLRWAIAPEVFPKGCGLKEVRSTGVTAGSVVIAQCMRPPLHSVPPVDTNPEPVLLGFDANTGEQLWLNDEGFALASGVGASDAVAAVVRRDQKVGSLDPQTGALRWVGPSDRRPCESTAHVINDQVVTGPCHGVKIRVLDGYTAQERLISLPVALPVVATDLQVLPLGAYDSSLLLQTRSRVRIEPGMAGRDRIGVLSADIDTGAVTFINSTTGSSRRSPLWGPLVQLGMGGRDGENWVEVYSLHARTLTRVEGLSVSAPRIDGSMWAQIGDHMVTAAAHDTDVFYIASVAADGTVTRSTSPCPQRDVGSRGPGIMVVPGATLVLCPSIDGAIHGWDILGMR